ncbi:hypothetical protein BJ166DRAFT_114804 [Pestalotiopsis sp. NC0098]|nr:hypothetical protein BJ166DRAFT_114804 [Pestalotiopsis sp. NC0098]
MPDTRTASPAESGPASLNQVPTSHPVTDAPRQRGLPAKLQRLKLSRQSRLGRLWSSQWIHPQRKAYIHTFVDATICWFMVAMIVYINSAAVLVHHINSDLDSEEFFKAHQYLQPVISVFVGFAFGSLFKTVGEWKGKHANHDERDGKKCVVFGQTRLPIWLYLCVTFVATFSLSFVASGGMKYVFGLRQENLQVNYIWCGVVTAVSAASILAVAADAVVRHKIFVIVRNRSGPDVASSEQPGRAKTELTTIV